MTRAEHADPARPSSAPVLPTYTRRASTASSSVRPEMGVKERSLGPWDPAPAGSSIGPASPVDIVRIDRFGRVPLHTSLALAGHPVTVNLTIAPLRHGVVRLGVAAKDSKHDLDDRGRLLLPLGVRHQSRLSPGDRVLIADAQHGLLIMRLDRVTVTVREAVDALA